MSALQGLQNDFQDYVLGRGGAAPAIVAAVRGQFGPPAEARLAIYHRAYRSRMREALETAYERTWSYLGDAMFAELADSYLQAHPSTFRNLRWFGGAFAAHLAQELPEHPYIAELARFEWALGLAFDAADAAPLGAAELAGVAGADWAGLRFVLHPSAQLLAQRWNSVALWQALGAQGEPPEAAECAAHWLVWRHAGQPHFRSLDALEADALRRVGRGAGFGAVCAAAEGGEGADVMARLAACLRAWLEQGVLTWPRRIDGGAVP
ncbi:DNA-binding domain-containing protein [Janthinobacterium sp.]|uniref:HvfC/BufC N-terminal domain-containing protein n=1 Tax=Janthinobacterium sp. TaxID=1871054 RepID=UPI00293D1D22|nr:DNA-binding domain-containing protein [Janthinobacterium sp.]